MAGPGRFLTAVQLTLMDAHFPPDVLINPQVLTPMQWPWSTRMSSGGDRILDTAPLTLQFCNFYPLYHKPVI